MFPDGTVMTSAASPSTGSSSITDLNLGADIGAAGSGVLSFSTAGTERMRVANNGNVGIGNAAPTALLDVNGTIVQRPAAAANVSTFLQTNAGLQSSTTNLNPGVAVWLDGGNIYGMDLGYNNSRYRNRIVAPGMADITFGFHTTNTLPTAQTSYTERMVIRGDSGSVGVGTTSPQRLLDLNSGASGGLTEQLVLRNAGTSTTAGTGAGLYFALTNASTSRHAAIDALISNAPTGATDLTLSTYNGTSVTEKMRIQAGGSVGIGTSTPFNKLTVAGSADFTGNVGIGSNVPTQALDVAGVIRSSTGGIMFPDGSIMTSAATPGTGTSSTSDLTFVADSGETGTGVITFAARGSERMRITNGGSIGFGTAVPLSKVDVAGGMAVGSYAGANAAPSNGLIVSGNVGIGLTSPTDKLDVVGKVAAISSGGSIWDHVAIWADSLYGYIDVGNANTLRMRINTGTSDGPNTATYSDVMTLTASGNVGIGTTSPGSKLHVNGNAAIGYSTSTAGPTNGLSVSGNVGIGTIAPTQMLEVAGTIRSTSGGIMFPDGTVMTTASGGTSSGTTSDTDLAFASGTGTSSSGVITLATHNLERMRVDYNGNVGIGAAAPVNKLDVAGGVAIGSTYAGGTTSPTNGLIVQGNVGIGTTSPTRLLHIFESGTLSSGGLLAIEGSATGINSNQPWGGINASVLNSNQTNNTMSALAFGTRDSAGAGITTGAVYTVNTSHTQNAVNGDLALATTSSSISSERMRITSAGNVGIGTTNPVTKVHINNKIADDASRSYDGNALMVVNQTPTSTTTLNDSKPVLYLGRQGTSGQAYGAMATFGLSRYENSGTASRTRLDLSLMHGSFTDATVATFLSNGNVGIGSAAPAQKLDVAGAIRSSSGGFVFPDGTIMTTAVTATTAGASSTTDLNLVADSDAAGIGAIVVATNGTERMRVLNSGRVGIGTSIPQSALDVSGGMSLGSYAGVNAAPSNGLIVSGNVGIGTTAPAQKLDVAGNVNIAAGSKVFMGGAGVAAPGVGSAGEKIQLWGTAGTVGAGDYALGIENSNMWFNTGGGFKWYVGSAVKTVMDSNGNVGIGTTSPTQRLQVGTSGDGTVALANAWNTFSDIRLKRDLTVIPDALDKLLELHGYYYFWKDGSDQTRQVGVVAQEVEKILPELVRTGSDGIKTVDYPKLTAVLIEGTKQLKAEKDSEIAKLKARADAAEAEAALLKRALCDKFPDLAVCSH